MYHGYVMCYVVEQGTIFIWNMLSSREENKEVGVPVVSVAIFQKSRSLVAISYLHSSAQSR